MRFALAIILVIAALGGAGWYFLKGRGAVKAKVTSSSREASAEARCGALKITVLAQGKIAAKEAERIKHKIDGQMTITEIVDEGKNVKKGEVLVKFDDGKIKDKLRAAVEEHKGATAAVEIAAEELQIVERENAEALQQAQFKLNKAELELERYQKGEMPRKEKDLIFGVEQAQSALKQAKQSYESVSDPTLVKEGFVTANQIEQERIKLRSAEISLEKARGSLDDFRKYTCPATLKTKQSEVESAQVKLEKIKSVNANKLKQKRADLKQKQEKARLAKKQVEKIEKMMEDLVLEAPRDGLVLYGEQRRWYSRNTELKVGSQIYKNNVIITLPDLSQLVVKSQVEEADITKIKKGMKAVVTSDAYPDLALTGTVTKIGNVPQQHWYETTKKFDVTIELPAGELGLKPGVSAKCEIQVAELADVLNIPITAVFSHEDRQIVYLEGGKVTAKEVTLGKANDTHVVVKSGLQQGDKVLLYEPENIPLPPESAKPETATASTSDKADADSRKAADDADVETKAQDADNPKKAKVGKVPMKVLKKALSKKGS